MGKTRKEEKDFIRTEIGKKLYDYNNENSGYTSEDISEFISGASRSRTNDIFNAQPQQTPDYLGGVSPLGSYIDYDASKYDENIHEDQLWNLEDFREQNQGVFDSLGRATANLIGKTAVNVVGGLAGTAYGAVDAIANGEVSRLWDNDLTTELDKASNAIGDYFRVYKSNDFNERNLVARAVLNPAQFTDQVMDTLSFTTGAVITELISGGLASSMVVPRALRYFKGLNKASEMAEVGEKLAGGSSSLLRGLGNAGTLSRQLATGAAYEAAVESRHASMELRDVLYNQWLEDNPGLSLDQMPEDVRNSIDDRLSDAGLFTFLTNIALVGGSNIMQFPKVFGAGYNTSKRANDLSRRISRNAQGEFVDSALPTSRGGRIASNIATFARNPIMEGLVEEGGQGVISGLATDFWSRKYDLDSKANINDFLESFGKSLIETYTTAEGWEEIGMGMIIGSLGAPGRGALSIFGNNTRLGNYGFNEDGSRREIWTGGIAGAFQERSQQAAEVARYIEELSANTSLMDAMKANYDFLVQSDSLDKSMEAALNRNDVFNFNNFRDDKIHAYIASRIKSGLSSDLETTVDQLKRTDYNDLYVELRGQEAADKATDGEKRFFKNNTIEEFENKIKATTDAYNTVDNVYTGDNEEIRDYFAHSIASAKYLDIREKDINNKLSEMSNGALNNLNIRDTSTITINQEIERLNDMVKSSEISNEEKSEINNILSVYNNVQDKQRELTLDDYQALSRLQSADPVALSLNIDEITNLLSDSRKIRSKRQSFIEDYNNMFTEEGIKKIQKQQREYLQEQERIRQEQEAEIRAQEAEQAKLDEELRVQDKKAEIKAKKEAAELKKTDVAEETELNEDEVLGRLEAFANAQETGLLDESGNIISDSEISDIELKEEDIRNRWQEELDNLKSEYDQNKLLDPNTPEPIEERDSIHAKYQSMIDRLNNNITPEENVVADEIEYEENYNNKLVLKEDGLIRNPLESEDDTYRFEDLTFKREIANTLISLNINYAENILGNISEKQDEYRIFSGYTEDGRLDINSNFDSRLQDPGQFNVGTKVNIMIPTYSQIESRGIEGGGYSEAQYNEDINNPDKFPIAFTDNDGNIIGYLPTIDNVKKRVAPEYLNTELVKNRDLRSYIFDNRDTNMTATINSKSTGTPMFQRNQVSIYEALGDGNRLADGVKIGVFKEGKLQVGLNNVFQDKIKLPDESTYDSYFNEGYIYAVVPTAVEGEHLALNMNVNTLNESSSDVVIKMLELYKATDKIAADSNLLAERERLSMEVDFSNFRDLNDALESILYINNDNDNYMFRVDNNKLILGLTPDMQFTWNQFRKPETKDKIRDILSKRFYAVRLANFNNPFTSFSLNDNRELELTRNKNYFDYLNNANVISTNIQSEPISNKANERYFTAQSVIGIGNVKSEPRQLQLSKTRTVEEINNDRNRELEQAERAWSENVDERGFPREALPPILKEINDRYDAELAQISEPESTLDTQSSVSATETKDATKKPKNKLGLKIKSNRNKPRIDEDLSEIINTEISLDNQAELLMKKCSK